MLRNYYADRLESKELDAYYMLDSAVRSLRPDCRLYGLDQPQAHRVLTAYAAENPDVWNFCVQFVRMQIDSQGILCRLSYYEGNEALFVQKKEELLTRIKASITTQSTDYEVAKKVYDLLAKTVSADMQTQNAYLQNPPQSEQEIHEYLEQHGNAFTAYGAIVEKKAVCMGISAAYKLLLDELRVECACVSGQEYGQNHQMNVVEIDGVRAYVDVTKGVIREQMPMVFYDAFMMPASHIEQTFTPDEDFGCTGDRWSYFSQSKCKFKDLYSLRRYLNALTYSSTKGEIRFQYTGTLSDDEIGKMMSEILSIRCARDYEIAGYIVDRGIGNCYLRKYRGT